MGDTLLGYGRVYSLGCDLHKDYKKNRSDKLMYSNMLFEQKIRVTFSHPSPQNN